MKCLSCIDVGILSGGLGTRIRPVLGDTPKLLAPIGNRRFIDVMFEWLAGFGATRIVLMLGYGAAQIGGYLAARPSRFAIATSIEAEPLGTAGALRLARPLFRSDPVIVMNGDSFIDADPCELIARHAAAGRSGAIMCANVADTSRYGRIVADEHGLIRRFREKSAVVASPGLINAGIYCLGAKLLDEIAVGSAHSLERDVFAPAPHGAFVAVSGGTRFVDIGTPDDYALAAKIIELSRHL